MEASSRPVTIGNGFDIPILLVLIIGALEFKRLFFTKIVITNAAREGRITCQLTLLIMIQVRIQHQVPLLQLKQKLPIQGSLTSQWILHPRIAVLKVNTALR